MIERPKKGQCRWCGKKLYWDYLYEHEPKCLSARRGKVDFELTSAAQAFARNQLEWSMDMAKRWRSLPGKGWGFLDMVPMVELVGKGRLND